MKKQYNWQIVCKNSPEIIDRVVAPLRKRGLGIEKFLFEKNGEKSICNLKFEIEEDKVSYLKANLMRITDVEEIQSL